MKKVVVTGSNGVVGSYVVKHLREAGYRVLPVDQQGMDPQDTSSMTVDLTDIGQCYGALKGADAVIHLAAIPRALIYPNDVIIKNNVTSTYNVLEAADTLGIKKAVVASSECAFGLIFSENGIEPQYVPMDEEHPCLPEDAYGLSKIIGEQIAEAIHRRSGMQIITFRLGNVITENQYEKFPKFINDPNARKIIMWNYIDVRDIANACQMAIEAEGLGATVMNLAAEENCMNIKSIDLMKEGFPNVTDFREPIDQYQSLYSVKKVKEVLGWEQKHFWRDYVKHSN